MRYRDLVRPDFPYRRPSFLSGFASALDIAAPFRRRRTLPRFDAKSDERALARDWAMVGQDLQRALDRFAQK